MTLHSVMAKDDTIPVACEPQFLCVNHAASGLSRLFQFKMKPWFTAQRRKGAIVEKNRERGNVVLGCYPQVTIEQMEQENDTRTTHTSYITPTTTDVLLW